MVGEYGSLSGGSWSAPVRKLRTSCSSSPLSSLSACVCQNKRIRNNWHKPDIGEDLRSYKYHTCRSTVIQIYASAMSICSPYGGYSN